MHVAKRVNLTLYLDDDAHYRAYQWYMQQPAKQRSNFVANCINMASENNDNGMKTVQGLLQTILQKINSASIGLEDATVLENRLDFEDDGIDDANMALLDMF